MSNYCSKGHWENGMQLPCKQCEIEHLSEQVEKLKAELKSIDGALNDPRANLTLTTSEIILELKEQNEKMRAFVIKVSEQTPEKPDYWSSCGQCEHNSSNAEDLLELPDLATSILNKEEGEIK